jgi:hypothetical protein
VNAELRLARHRPFRGGEDRFGSKITVPGGGIDGELARTADIELTVRRTPIGRRSAHKMPTPGRQNTSLTRRSTSYEILTFRLEARASRFMMPLVSLPDNSWRSNVPLFNLSSRWPIEIAGKGTLKRNP